MLFLDGIYPYLETTIQYNDHRILLVDFVLGFASS